jgi:hypothetical protein
MWRVGMMGLYEDKTDRLNNYRKDLDILKRSFSDQLTLKFLTEKEISSINVILKAIDMKYKNIVNNAKDSSGKAVYSNAEQRESAVYSKSREDEEYIHQNSLLVDKLNSLEECKNSLELSSKTLQIIQSLIKIEEISQS